MLASLNFKGQSCKKFLFKIIAKVTSFLKLTQKHCSTTKQPEEYLISLPWKTLGSFLPSLLGTGCFHSARQVGVMQICEFVRWNRTLKLTPGVQILVTLMMSEARFSENLVTTRTGGISFGHPMNAITPEQGDAEFSNQYHTCSYWKPSWKYADSYHRCAKRLTSSSDGSMTASMFKDLFKMDFVSTLSLLTWCRNDCPTVIPGNICSLWYWLDLNAVIMWWICAELKFKTVFVWWLFKIMFTRIAGSLEYWQHKQQRSQGFIPVSSRPCKGNS